MIFIVIFLFVVVLTLLLLQTIPPKNFPPGPVRLPVVGCLWAVRRLSRRLGGQHLALGELGRRHHTPVLGLRLGGDDVVAVLSYPAVRAVLAGEEFDGRPDNFFLRLRCMGCRNGITCVDGEQWHVQRSFVVRHLRSLGLGRRPMEAMVAAEAADVLAQLVEQEETQLRRLRCSRREGTTTVSGEEQRQPHLRHSNHDNNTTTSTEKTSNPIMNNGSTCVGVELDPAGLLAPAVLNVLWSWTTGERFPRGDRRLARLLGLLGRRQRAFDMSGGALAQLPWLRHLAPQRTGYRLVCQLNRGLRDLLMEAVMAHRDLWTPDRDDDLIYAFLTEMRREGAHPSFTDDQLVMVCLDMFIAGGHTTSNTLDFAFLAMILYPDIQAKVHSHLDAAFQMDQPIEYAHRVKVPYIEAVLMEVQRFYNITPITGPRRALKDTVLEGYNIPKNTTILISTYAVLNDKEYWKDPEVFRPERFLSQDGKLVTHERMIPFGMGRRRCPGEMLARSCIFTFFCEIMRQYGISVARGSPPPTGMPVPGITLTPQPYRAHLTRRHAL